ncbi:8512_t:CDS:2, partial [Funneliformis caledonium]
MEKPKLYEAGAELKKFKEGEDDGKWLKKLRRKLDNKEWEDKEQKERWEKSVKEFEEEKKSLEAEKKRWGDQVEYLQKKLVEFGEGK